MPGKFPETIYVDVYNYGDGDCFSTSLDKHIKDFDVAEKGKVLVYKLAYVGVLTKTLMPEKTKK